jgi:hypothetical protein
MGRSSKGRCDDLWRHKGLSKEVGSFLGYSAGKRLAFAEYAIVQTFPVLKFESSRVTILPNTTPEIPSPRAVSLK